MIVKIYNSSGKVISKIEGTTESDILRNMRRVGFRELSSSSLDVDVYINCIGWHFYGYTTDSKRYVENNPPVEEVTNVG